MKFEQIKHVEDNYFVHFSEETGAFSFFCVANHEFENHENLINHIKNMKMGSTFIRFTIQRHTSTSKSLKTTCLYGNGSYKKLKIDTYNIERLYESDVKNFIKEYTKNTTEDSKNFTNYLNFKIKSVKSHLRK